MLYSLHVKQKLIGLFDSLGECSSMAEGLVVNNFVSSNNILIKEFKKNSICFKRDLELNENMQYITDNDTDVSYETDSSINDSVNETDSLEEKVDMDEIRQNEEYMKIEEEKRLIQERIKILKQQKEKVEESKNIFEHDLKLFDTFKGKMEEDKEFIIPELFETKFKIMIELEDEDKLEWEEFIERYDPEFVDNSYTSLFDLQNDALVVEEVSDDSDIDDEDNKTNLDGYDADKDSYTDSNDSNDENNN
mgnify:CR=1 FL=1